jgi:hypothetical protein
MRQLRKLGLLGALAAGLVLMTTGCASSGSHAGYSSGPYGSGYSYGVGYAPYRSAGYGCRRGYVAPGFRRSRYDRYGYRGYRRRPGVSVGFHLD